MGDPRGFIEVQRVAPKKRDVSVRLDDYDEVDVPLSSGEVEQQARRCMNCGIPFCHKGCPLGNYIPEWNELTYEGDIASALQRLHATNNFPEFTGRVCPAPCEQACVLNIDEQPVNIKQVERHIIDEAFDRGLVQPEPPRVESGKRVAIVGSGPAGLAAAQQLRRAGHLVYVFERDQEIGGLLRYGIPDFKLSRLVVNRRLEQLSAEGIVFRPGVAVGTGRPLDELRREFDAVCLATGAQRHRLLPIAGAELNGVSEAMPYLTGQNQVVSGLRDKTTLSARGKRVVILGGGDTGADCLGTALRQGATRVYHYHYKPALPRARTEEMPWPWLPMTLQESTSHEEGGERDFNVLAKAFLGDGKGQLRALQMVRVAWTQDRKGSFRMHELPDSTFELEVELALLAIGFLGTEDGFGLPLTRWGTFKTGERYQTPLPGVFACGDARQGASLVVTAIWEGREAAHYIDAYLSGKRRLPTLPDHMPLADTHPLVF